MNLNTFTSIVVILNMIYEALSMPQDEDCPCKNFILFSEKIANYINDNFF